MGVQFSVFARKGGAIHGCIFFRDVEDQTGESTDIYSSNNLIRFLTDN